MVVKIFVINYLLRETEMLQFFAKNITAKKIGFDEKRASKFKSKEIRYFIVGVCLNDKWDLKNHQRLTLTTYIFYHQSKVSTKYNL